MRTAKLSTKHVARLLSVSEATIKRWADEGVLKSEKTVGGHRRFRVESIAQLRRERNRNDKTVVAPRVSKKTLKPLPSADDFLQLILSGDEAEAGAALAEGYLAHHDLDAIFETTVTPAMYRLGELWLKGGVTIAEEHLATQVVLTAIQKLRGVVAPHGPNGLTAICCVCEGELHEVAVHIVELILESKGWNVINLGANTPLFSLQEMVNKRRPELVCISAHAIADLDRSAAEFAHLRRVTNRLESKIALGGEAFRNRDLRGRFPADFYPENFYAVSRLAAKLMKQIGE